MKKYQLEQNPNQKTQRNDRLLTEPSQSNPNRLNINLRSLKQRHSNIRKQQQFYQNQSNPVNIKTNRVKYSAYLPYNWRIPPLRSIDKGKPFQKQQSIPQINDFQAQYQQIIKQHNIKIPIKLKNRKFKSKFNFISSSSNNRSDQSINLSLSQIRSQISRRSFNKNSQNGQSKLKEIRVKTEFQKGLPIYCSSSIIKQQQKDQYLQNSSNRSSIVKTKSFKFKNFELNKQFAIQQTIQSKNVIKQTNNFVDQDTKMRQNMLEKVKVILNRNDNKKLKSSYQFQKTTKHFINTEYIKVNHAFLKNKHVITQFLNHFQMLWDIKVSMCKKQNASETKNIFEKIKGYIFNDKKGNIANIIGIFYCSNVLSRNSPRESHRNYSFQKNQMQITKNQNKNAQYSASEREKQQNNYERFSIRRTGAHLYSQSNRNSRDNPASAFRNSKLTPRSESLDQRHQNEGISLGIQLHQNLKTIICLERWMILNFVDLIARKNLEFEVLEEMRSILQNLLGFYHFLFWIITESIENKKRQLELKRLTRQNQHQQDHQQDRQQDRQQDHQQDEQYQQIFVLVSQYQPFKQVLKKLSKSFIIKKSDFRLLIENLQSKLTFVFKINTSSYPYFGVFGRKAKQIVQKANKISIQKAFYELLSAYSTYLNQFQENLQQEKLNTQNKSILKKSNEKSHNPYQLKIIQFFLTCPSPYITKKSNQRFTLVFGLNQLLVDFSYSDFSTYNYMKKQCTSKQISPNKSPRNNWQYQFQVRYRHYSIKILQNLSKDFEIIIFTSYLRSPALQIVLKPLLPYVSEVLYKQHITRGKQGNVKDLSKIGRNLSRVLIIDHDQNNFRKHRQNGVLISPWRFDQSEFKRDNALIQLYQFFRLRVQNKFNQIQDIRTIVNQFQHWKQQFLGKLEKIQQEEASERAE